jgi:hypothetical protein
MNMDTKSLIMYHTANEKDNSARCIEMISKARSFCN